MSSSTSRGARRTIAGIALTYAVVGILWILLSDSVAHLMRPEWQDSAQRYKGLAYVGLTTLGLVVLMRSSLRRLLRALEEQAARFHQLHASLGEVLWMSSADGRQLQYVSPAFASVYGRPIEALQQDPGLWLDAVHPLDRPLAEASQEQLQRQGQASCTYRVLRPDGSVRWIADRKHVIRNELGQVAMIGGIAEDITAQHERDEVQADMQARLSRMVDERTQALQQANVELDAFTRTAAHDLKSPLSAMAGLGYLLRTRYAGVLDAAGVQMAERIEQSAHEMAELINDLLSLSRVGNAALALQSTDLAPMVHTILDDLRGQEPQRRLELHMPDRIPVDCDPGLIRSLLLNVLGNAWKFSGERETTRIDIEVERPPGLTGIAVRDNGTGFDMAQAGRLFRPFERLHTDIQFKGTGLGLVTCRRVIQRHGGDIWLDACPGEGTTVHFTLPDAPAACR